MSLVFDDRTLVLDGKPFVGKAVKDGGTLYLPASIFTSTGAVVTGAGPEIHIDRKPAVTMAKTTGNKVQIVRIPGSTRFDSGSRATPTNLTDSNGNVLQLNAQVTDGKLTDLSGQLHFANSQVTADIGFTFQNGVIVPSGQISFTSGTFQITVSANPGGFSGQLAYNTPECAIALKVSGGSSKPTSLSLSVAVHF